MWSYICVCVCGCLKCLKAQVWWYSRFFLLSTNHIKRPKTNTELILLTSIVCAVKASIVVQKLLKNTSLSLTVALGDTFLHYHENGHWSLFWADPTHAPSCCCKYSLAAENSPQEMHHLLLLSSDCWKLQCPAVLRNDSSFFIFRDSPLQWEWKILGVTVTDCWFWSC